MRLFRNYRMKNIRQIKPQVSISREAFELIIDTTKSNPRVETGGILMGHDIESLKVNVTHASLPGKNAFHSANEFRKDIDYCSKVLKEHYDKYGVDYVGEWHSHVLPLRGVSNGDIITLLSITNDPDYNFKAFACIVAVLNNNVVEMRGYVVDKRCIYQADLLIC